MASTVAMIGNGASSPLSCGPSQPATAVSVSTSASAQPARIGRSHAGAGSRGPVGPGARGVSASAIASPTNVIASAAPAGTEKALNSAVATANASHPASMLTAQLTRPAKRAYTTTNALSETRPSRVPTAAPAANEAPCASA